MQPLALLFLASAASPEMLVSTDWLASHLNDPALVILHVGSQKDYDAGHIPGARLVTLGNISVDGERDIRLELPPVAALTEAFSKLGVSDSSRIVLYTGTDSVQSATRVWFTLDYLGAASRTSLLNGGLSLWRTEKRPVSTEATSITPGKFTARPRPEVVATAEWVRAHGKDPEVGLIDARLPQFYSGAEPGMASRAGHIPGARNVPYSSLLDDQRRLLPVEELRKRLGTGRPVVSYCHIGQQATLVYFTARYLGLDVKLYDGSFRDWAGREDFPVESGVGSRRRFLAYAGAATVPAWGAAAPSAIAWVDYHAHIDAADSLDQLFEIATRRGIRLGVVEHAGDRRQHRYRGLLAGDEDLQRYLDRLAKRQCFKGIQAEGLDWMQCFSKPALRRLDYILSDALTMPDPDGTLVRIWTPAVRIPDVKAWMERYVEHHVRTMATTPIDILANPLYLPEQIQRDAEILWTAERMQRIVRAAARHRVAMEINSRFKLPQIKFLKMARAAGVKFSFGSNILGPEVGNLDYPRQIVKELTLTPRELFKPGRKRVDAG